MNYYSVSPNEKSRAKFLQKITSKHHHGFSPSFEKAIRFTNGEYTIKNYFTHQGKKWLKGISLQSIYAHMRGDHHLYIQTDYDPRNPLTVIGIDIDCHKKGTKEGAEKFLHHVEKTFRSIVWNHSRGGNGINAYLLLDKGSMTSEQVRKSLDHLERWLKAEAVGFDVQMVEVRGKPAIYKGIHLQNMGTLIRAPMVDIQDTALVTLQQLDNLNIKPVKVAKTSGSCSFWNDQYWKEAKQLSHEITNRMPTRRVNDKMVCTRDIQTGLLIMRICYDHKRPDGSLPTACIKALWNQFYQEGHIERSYDGQRWKLIRDAIDAYGLITWKDNRYHQGKCCQWEIAQEALDVMEDNTKETLSLLLVEAPKRTIPVYVVPLWVEPDIDQVWAERGYQYAETG